MQICQNIKKARVSKEMSQQAVADKMSLMLGAKIERDTYKNWEIGTEPSLSILKTIAAALEIPAYTLLNGIIEFSDEPEAPGEVEFGFRLSQDYVEKIRFSLNVLDSVFSLDPGSKKDKSQKGQIVPLSGSKKTHSSKVVKSKQRGNV